MTPGMVRLYIVYQPRADYDFMIVQIMQNGRFLGLSLSYGFRVVSDRPKWDMWVCVSLKMLKFFDFPIYL